MILWLGVACRIQGWDVFSELWIASLAFFATSSLVLQELLILAMRQRLYDSLNRNDMIARQLFFRIWCARIQFSGVRWTISQGSPFFSYRAAFLRIILSRKVTVCSCCFLLSPSPAAPRRLDAEWLRLNLNIEAGSKQRAHRTSGSGIAKVQVFVESSSASWGHKRTQLPSLLPGTRI